MPCFKVDALCSGFVRVDADSALVLWTLELHNAVCEGKERVVVADATIHASVELGAALANDDRSSLNDFASVSLNAQAFGIRISTVTG